MRTFEEYKLILELWEQGFPKKRIAIMTGIPRPTVRDCIERYGSVEGLERQREHASKSSVEYALRRIVDAENGEVHKAYAYLLGLYLGDGSIVKMRRVYRLRVTLDAKYPNIIQSCFQTIKFLFPQNKIGIVEHFYQGKLSCVDVSGYYKHWPVIFPQHAYGSKKHEREIKLEDWQQQIVDTYPLEFFRGLYHSDGSRFSNVVKGKDYPRYAFTNNSDDIRRLFCETCDRLGIHWTEKAQYRKARDIFISKRKDVEYLDSVIGPKS
jgi:hypothetical protein